MKFPVFLYDDLCTSCTYYARMLDESLDGKITMLGLHSKVGTAFCNLVFPPDVKVKACSWFCNDGYAYGGRNGIFHVLKYMLFAKKDSDFEPNIFDDGKCIGNCRTMKGVAFRSFSIITMSKKVKLLNLNIT